MPVRNLRAILDSAGAKNDHNPRTIDVHETRAGWVNECYLSLNARFDWTHLETTVQWPVFANRTETTTGFTCDTVAGAYTVTFSGALGTSITDTNGFLYNAGGMTFEGDDGETYTITRFTSTTVMVLNKPYTTTGTVSTWTIRAERFFLPRDTERPLGFVNRSQGLGRMTVLTRRQAELAFGTDPDSQAGTIYWLVDDDMEYQRAPDSGWTATDDTMGGSLAASSVFEVCYTFDYGNRESPPSPPVRVTTSSAASHRIQVDGMESTLAGSGIYKNVYVRWLTKGTDATTNAIYGRWLYVTQVNETTLTATISTMPVPTVAELYDTVGRKFMQTKWAPGADQFLELRYLRAPRALVADSHIPDWPEAFHDLLVYHLAIEIGLQHSTAGGKIDRWKQSHDAMVREFMAAKINVPDAPNRRAMRGVVPAFGGYPVRGGIVTGDFSG